MATLGSKELSTETKCMMFYTVNLRCQDETKASLWTEEGVILLVPNLGHGRVLRK